MAPRPVVVDNTVLSNSALVGRCDLVLLAWASRACTTNHAHAEYESGAAAGRVPPGAWHDLPIVILTEDEVRFSSFLSQRLAAGERTSLAVAHHRQGVLASDDRDARRAARRHGVETTGMVGILVLGVRSGYLSRDAANSLLHEMITLGYRSPVTSLDTLID
jgi:predicted nucleic acid-binding protein